MKDSILMHFFYSSPVYRYGAGNTTKICGVINVIIVNGNVYTPA